MALIFLPTEEGFAISDLDIVASLLACGAVQQREWIAEKKRVLTYVMTGEAKGDDGKVHKMTIEITDAKEVNEMQKKHYTLIGSKMPQGNPIMVFEVVPPAKDLKYTLDIKGHSKDIEIAEPTKEDIQNMINAIHRGQLKVNQKQYEHEKRDLLVLVHHHEMINAEDLPEEWR